MKKENNNKGFTILEVAISSFIMVVIGVTLVSLQYILQRSQTTLFNSSINVDEANMQISTIVREIRTARAGGNGSYILSTVNAQEIVFFSDIDYDEDSEKVRYFLEGNTLKKGVIEPVGFPVTYPSASEKVRILSENVRNNTLPVFIYYNGDYPTDTQNNPLPYPADVTEVKLIRISLRLNTKDDDPNTDYVLESFANLRTLKDNL